jgi:hypothetical protein
MYVRTYVRTYVCMYVCMYVYVCTYVYVCFFSFEQIERKWGTIGCDWASGTVGKHLRVLSWKALERHL